MRARCAHHEDDADENRIAELGKGNIVHINGMSSLSTLLGVNVVRPLLAVRKSDLVDFAERARVCYMQDSTPKWSRRGWIRRTLDKIATEDLESHVSFLSQLSPAGSAFAANTKLCVSQLARLESCIHNLKFATRKGPQVHWQGPS